MINVLLTALAINGSLAAGRPTSSLVPELGVGVSTDLDIRDIERDRTIYFEGGAYISPELSLSLRYQNNHFSVCAGLMSAPLLESCSGDFCGVPLALVRFGIYYRNDRLYVGPFGMIGYLDGGFGGLLSLRIDEEDHFRFNQYIGLFPPIPFDNVNLYLSSQITYIFHSNSSND